jgi:hypothetical protein
MNGPLKLLMQLACSGLIILPTPALAQLQYGPWVNSGQCKRAPPPSGPGRQGLEMPQAVGGSGPAQECLWTRQVTDCPRLRDKIMHPGKCSGKVREQRKRSHGPPRD